MIIQLRRWLPKRDLVVVADSSYAALKFLHNLSLFLQLMPVELEMLRICNVYRKLVVAGLMPQ